MTTTGAVEGQARLKETQNNRNALAHEPICSRCGGLMIREYCTDLLNSTVELDCPVARCVQCGDVVDPVIRRNRQLQQVGGTAPEMRASSSPVPNQISV